MSHHDEHEYDCGAIRCTFEQHKTAPEKMGLIGIYGDGVRIDRDVAKNFVSRTRLRLIINGMKVKLGERWRRKEILCGKQLIMVERVDANRWKHKFKYCIMDHRHMEGKTKRFSIGSADKLESWIFDWSRKMEDLLNENWEAHGNYLKIWKSFWEINSVFKVSEKF